MAVTSFSRRPAWLVSAGLVLVAGLVVSVALAVGAEPEPEIIEAVPIREPEPEPEPDPEPEPEPEPPAPVEGEITGLEVVDLSATGSRVFKKGSAEDKAVPADGDAVEQFAAAIAAWLDAHLTDLQDDGPGLVEGLVGDTQRVAEALASSDAPVRTASYALQIGARGAPEWGQVTVSIHRGRGVTHNVAYTFLPGEQPILVAAEVLPYVVDPPERDHDSFSIADEVGA